MVYKTMLTDFNMLVKERHFMKTNIELTLPCYKTKDDYIFLTHKD